MSSSDLNCRTGTVEQGETTMDLGDPQNFIDEMDLELNSDGGGFKYMETRMHSRWRARHRERLGGTNELRGLWKTGTAGAQPSFGSVRLTDA